MTRHFFSPVFMRRPLEPEVLEHYISFMSHEEAARAAELLCRRMVLPELMRITRGSYGAERFAMPSLFVFGTQDVGFPPAVTSKAFADPAQYGPDVRLQMIEEAGHFVVDEQPAALCEAILAFYQSLEP